MREIVLKEDSTIVSSYKPCYRHVTPSLDCQACTDALTGLMKGEIIEYQLIPSTSVRRSGSAKVPKRSLILRSCTWYMTCDLATTEKSGCRRLSRSCAYAKSVYVQERSAIGSWCEEVGYQLDYSEAEVNKYPPFHTLGQAPLTLGICCTVINTIYTVNAGSCGNLSRPRALHCLLDSSHVLYVPSVFLHPFFLLTKHGKVAVLETSY